MQDTKAGPLDITQNYGFIKRICSKYWQFNVEDLAHDVVLRILTRRPESLPRTNIEAWLVAVVRNVAMDKYRQMKKEELVVDRFASVDANGEFADSGDTDHKVLLAHQIYLEQEVDEDMRAVIRQAFESLPEAQREVLTLHCDGKSYSQIAEITNANIGTVRSRLHYGKNKVQELLADYQ